MTTQQFKSMLNAQPFRPFDIHMANGRSLPVPVRHPELVIITPGGRTIGVAVHEDAIEIIDLLLVTSLQPHTNGTASS
jgi:hypothetical protein